MFRSWGLRLIGEFLKLDITMALARERVPECRSMNDVLLIISNLRQTKDLVKLNAYGFRSRKDLGVPTHERWAVDYFELAVDQGIPHDQFDSPLCLSECHRGPIGE
jgi:hypothetical protein